MRRLVLTGSAALAFLALPAAPAQALDNVICVNIVDPSCNQTALTITAADLLADGNSVDDTILVGPGNYVEPPLDLFAGAHTLTLTGAGEGLTFITPLPDVLPQT